MKMLLLGYFLLLQSCVLPLNANKDAFFVVINNLNQNIEITLGSDTEYPSTETLAASETLFLIHYQQKRNEKRLPNGLSNLLLELDTCTIKLDRQALEALAKPPDGGRAGFDLTIDQALLDQHTCR